MVEVPLDRSVTSELERNVKFGGKGKIEEGGFFAQIANQPIAFPLRKVFEELNQPVSLDLYKRFEVWLVPHRLAIVRRRGQAEPTSVGMEIEYQTDGRTCAAAALLPSFQFVVHGEARVRGTLTTAGEAGADTGTVAPPGPSLVKAGFEFSSQADGKLGFQFQATVCTPVIAAVGLGASRCEWRFDKLNEPLFGKDIETWTALVLPKRMDEVTYRARFYMNTRTLFLSTRRESDWVSVVCGLGV